MKKFKPDAVVGVGGYSSFPVLRMAQAKRIPNFLLEPNSFAGKSNIMLGRKATRIFTGTDGMEKFFPPAKIMITGNPVRASIAESTITRSEGIKFFALEEKKKTVLVMGGSLGARSINEAIAAGLDEVVESAGLQLIWQTGKPFAEKAKTVAAGKPSVWVNEFIREMEYAYAAADIVVARAGAMTVAELCVARKPVIFVPYPFAAEDHQTANASQLVNKRAAEMIRDEKVGQELARAIILLAKDEQRQTEFSRNIARLAVMDADRKIAAEIMKAAQ